ncbi:hypothetical protein CRYUN_Cryun07bG0123200 [Craigia yunnanensis]
MGYVLRVRLASFFTGAATASFLGLYILYKDYKVAHESIAQQTLAPFCFSSGYVMLFLPIVGHLSSTVVLYCALQNHWYTNYRSTFGGLVACLYFSISLCLELKSLHEPLDRRISALDSLKRTETSQHVEATE